MKNYSLFLLSLLILACSSVKKAQKHVNSGDYKSAINLSVKKLIKNKHKKSYQQHIFILKDAFNKSVSRDLEQIYSLKKDNNKDNYERIFNLYTQLDARQNKIKPLLPLRIIKTGKNVNFSIKNYQREILESKNNLINYVYFKVITDLNRPRLSKEEHRHIYDDLSYIDKLSPNFKDVTDLMKESHFKGTDFVFVSIKNETRQMIPKRLHNELMQFDTYGLNNFWTVYHSEEEPNLIYDYRTELKFLEINVTPERIKEIEYIREKIIKEKVVVKDSTGTHDSYENKKIVCRMYEVRQLKSCTIFAKVDSYNNSTDQLIKSYPLESSFVFKHTYATHNGDRRALDGIYIDMLSSRQVSFPSTEDMVYDAGRDLKNKLKDIITHYKK